MCVSQAYLVTSEPCSFYATILGSGTTTPSIQDTVDWYVTLAQLVTNSLYHCVLVCILYRNIVYQYLVMDNTKFRLLEIVISSYSRILVETHLYTLREPATALILLYIFYAVSYIMVI